MNINGIYLVQIFVKLSEKKVRENLVESNGKFVKYALVYKDKKESTYLFPVYVDLKTGERYKSFNLTMAGVGEIYISLKEGFIPLIDLIETEKENLSKRKILKMFNDSIKEKNKSSEGVE